MDDSWFNPDLEPDEYRQIGYRTIDIPLRFSFPQVTRSHE